MLNDNGKLKSEIEGIKVENEVKEKKTSLTEVLSMNLVENEKYTEFIEQFIIEGMNKNEDYAYFHNSAKPTLLKAGAEKLMSLFDLVASVEVLYRQEDWENKLFSYEIKVYLIEKENGQVIGEGVGHCSSKEKRIERNPDFCIPNTIIKMAKKRSLVDSVITTLKLSSFFTQDIEDVDKRNNHHAKTDVKEDSKKDEGGDGPARSNQLQKIYRLAEELDLKPQQAKEMMKSLYHVDDSRKLTSHQAKDFISKLRRLKERK